jgi:hypothetical protein
MLCVNCGKENRDDAGFCVSCGSSMKMINAGSEQPANPYADDVTTRLVQPLQPNQVQAYSEVNVQQQSFQSPQQPYPPPQQPYQAVKHKRKGKVRVVIGSFLCGFQVLAYVAQIVTAVLTGAPVFGNFDLSAGGDAQTAEIVGFFIGFNLFIIVGIILLLVGISKFKKSKPIEDPLTNQYTPISDTYGMEQKPKSDKAILFKLVAIGVSAVVLIFILIIIIGFISGSLRMISDIADNNRPVNISDNREFVGTFEAVNSRFKILDGWRQERIDGREVVVREDQTSIGITFNVVHADGYNLDTYIDMLVDLEANNEDHIVIDRRSIAIGEYEGAYLYTRYIFDGDTELFVHSYIVVKDEVGYVLIYLSLYHPAFHLADVELMASTLEID